MRVYSSRLRVSNHGESHGCFFFHLVRCILFVCLFFTVSNARATEYKAKPDILKLGTAVVDGTKTDGERIKSAKSLAVSQDLRALDYLFRVIRDTAGSPVFRTAIVRQLSESPHRRRVAEFIIESLKNPEEATEIRSAAAITLGELGLAENKNILREYIEYVDPAIRLASRQALLALGGKDVDRVALLGAILVDREQSDGVRAAAARQLAVHDDPRTLPFLREVLVEDLPSLPIPQTFADHMKHSSDLKTLVPIAAAWSMGQLGKPSAVPDLLAYTEAPESEMRATIFEALARIKNVQALDAARGALSKDKDQRVRRWAAVLLKELKVPETLPELRHALEKDPDPGVRLQVAQALESMRDYDALPLLEAALPKEELKEVRSAMEHAIRTLAKDSKMKTGTSAVN